MAQKSYRFMTVLATGSILAGIAISPTFAESGTDSGTKPTNAGGTLLGATTVVKAPKPVQALETWTDAGLRTLNIAYKAPTTGPANYLVEVVNITTSTRQSGRSPPLTHTAAMRPSQPTFPQAGTSSCV